MKMKFAFARKVAAGLLAVGFLSCLATDTFAANRTWTSSNIAAGSYRQKWGTAFTSNWNGGIVPTTADIATFGTNAFGQYNIQVQPGVSVAGVRFNNTGTNSYVFGTTGFSVGASGVNNQSGRQQTFGQTVTLTANQTWSGGSGAKIVSNNTELAGFNLTTSTDVVLNTLINTPNTTSTVTVTGGNLDVVGGGPDEHVNFVVTAGNLTTSDPGQGAGFNTSLSNLDVSGSGTYNNTKVGGPSGDTNWNLVTMSNGTIDLIGVQGNLVTNGYAQSGGTLKQYVGWDNVQGPFNSTVQATDGAGHATGPLSFGGALDIDFASVGSSSLAIGTTWNLFQGVNAGGAAASNFSTALLDNVDPSSPYYGLSFTKYGTEFFTGPAADGTYLVFQAQTGNLVVVPEPSTIVFAGLGVAMSGWTMWKKRRLSKLLAAKAG